MRAQNFNFKRKLIVLKLLVNFFANRKPPAGVIAFNLNMSLGIFDTALVTFQEFIFKILLNLLKVPRRENGKLTNIILKAG